MKRRKGNLHGCCNPIFVPLSRQTLYYIPQRTRIPMRPEKSFFQENHFCSNFFWVASECWGRFGMSHTSLFRDRCWLVATVFWWQICQLRCLIYYQNNGKKLIQFWRNYWPYMENKLMTKKNWFHELSSEEIQEMLENTMPAATKKATNFGLKLSNGTYLRSFHANLKKL